MSKLLNKYFATRCIDGDVCIWSATPHPDRVFELPNVDQEEQSNAQDTHRDSLREEDIAPTKEPDPPEGDDDDKDDGDGDKSEYDSEGNPVVKIKKKETPVVVKKDKSGRISSEKD